MSRNNVFAEAKKNGRHLKNSEITMIPMGLRREIDPAKVWLINHHNNAFVKNAILTDKNDIWWPNCPTDFANPSNFNGYHNMLGQKATLMHELCHVWQYKTGRLTKLKYLLRPKNWRYNYKFDANKSFDDYKIEEQADIVKDWYLMNNGYIPSSAKEMGPKPSRAELDKMVPFSWF